MPHDSRSCMNRQHRDSAGSRGTKLKFLTGYRQTTVVRCRDRNQAVVFALISKQQTLQEFSLYVFTCANRHKVLSIALYIVTEGSLSMFCIIKNDFSE